MPEHVHLLFSEPERGNPSLVLAALKQNFAHRLLRELRVKPGIQTDVQTGALWTTPVAVRHIWQRRFYDFVVFTEKKRVEKLRYMHRNPVVRGFVQKPEEWPWSSFRHYAYGESGPVLVNETQKAELHIRKIS
jgi:putative transposase